MMSSKAITPGSLIADHLKSRLAQAAAEIQALRTREVRKTDKRAGILAKAELCLLCGNADRPGSCTCISKAEAKFHEAAAKDCKLCGAKGQKVRQDGGLVTHAQPGKEKGLCNGIKMIKDEMRADGLQMAELGKSNVGDKVANLRNRSQALSGNHHTDRIPPGRGADLTSPDPVHTESQRQAANIGVVAGIRARAATKSTMKAEDLDKGILSTVKRGVATAALAGGLMSGGAAHAQSSKPSVPVKGTAKKPKAAEEKPTYLDMSGPAEKESEFPSVTPKGSFKSEMCATHGADLKKCGPGCGSVKPVAKGEYDNYCPACGGEGHHIGAMGGKDHFMCRHCGNGFHSENHGTASGESKESLMFGDEPKPLHPSDKPKAKAKAKPVKKEEMVANVKTAPEKTLPGAELPSDAGEKTFEAEGSGGQTSEKSDPAIKKSEPLQKDTTRSAPGMAPWGAVAPKLPGMTAAKPKATVASIRAAAAAAPPPAAMHPDTAASLASVKAAAPAASWKAQGLPGLKAKLATVAAVPIHAAPPVIPGRSLPAEGTRKPVPLSQPSDAANLASDKKAAGVGFLANLVSRFKGIGNKNWAKVGNGNANRIGAGAAALARSEKPMGLKVKSTIPKLQKKMKPMTKAEAFGGDNGLGNCLHCRKIEHGGPCKPLAKEMMEAPTQGLSSVNHNSRLVSFKPVPFTGTSRL